MPSEATRTCALEDCLDALIDYRGKTPRKTGAGIPLITAKVVKSGRVEATNEFIAPQDFDAWTTEAPLGEVGQILKLPVALAQRVVTLRGKEGLLHNDYLLYALQSEPFQAQLRGRSSGTTVVGIKQSELRKVTLDLPPLDSQREIAGILKSLDNRIDLMRQMNASLESIACALFKSWFIDFDAVCAKAEGREPEGMDSATAALFPAEFEESAVGLIPQGWKPGNLGAVCTNPRSQAKAGQMAPDTPYIGLEHMPRKSIALDCVGTAEGLASGKFWFERNDVLFGKLRPYFHKVGLAPCRGICSTDILVLRPRVPEWLGFVAMHACSEALVHHATQLSNGARMPRTSWHDIGGFEVVLPPQHVAAAFNGMVGTLFERIHANIEAARLLADARAVLLPRLISGKLCIPEAQTQLESAIA